MKKYKRSSYFVNRQTTYLSNESPLEKTINNTITNVIDPSLLTYIQKIHQEKHKSRKVISMNDEEKEILLNNGLNDNIHVDRDKKSKARRSLLYLLNIMSEGTFCPEINNYFDELRELKIKEENNKDNTKEFKEENKIENKTGNEFGIKNPIKRIQSLREQLLNNKPMSNNSEKYNFHFKKRGKDEHENYDNNVQSKFYINDFELKDFENYYSIDEIEKTNDSKFSFTLNKQGQARKKLFKQISDNERNKKYKKNLDKKQGNNKINYYNNNKFNEKSLNDLKKTKMIENQNKDPSFLNSIKNKIQEIKKFGEIKEENENENSSH